MSGGVGREGPGGFFLSRFGVIKERSWSFVLFA